MAAYNAQDTIALAVRSALEQTDHLLEVIVVDDASTDATCEILAAIQDPRLRVLRQKVRQGPGVARNRAMGLAAGQWFAILDADDAFHPQRLERIFAAHTHADERTVLGDRWLYCRSRGPALVPWRATAPLPPCMDLNLFLARKPFLTKPILPASVRTVGLFYPAYFSWEDAVFMSRVLARGYRLLLHQEPLYLYRLRWGSLSHDLHWACTTQEVFTALMEELKPALDDQGKKEIEAILHKAQRELRYHPVLKTLRQKRYGALPRLLLSDRFYRHEFLRRLWPSVLKNLSVLRFPGTTGR
jgi:succinoglycan biosynthesis protein ExoO